jgi:D-glycero-D-manno-heptose 1,7-bisphosphate phosphatase
MKIDTTWSLFLDRDGVINRRLIDDYVKTWTEFEFMPDAIETIAHLRSCFAHIFVVTNQQGIGKKIMNTSDLQSIHNQMLESLEKCNQTKLPIINQIYFCPSLKADNDHRRKPKIGMALQAQADHPKVDLFKSIMVGDSISDMEFGRSAGMKTIFFGEEKTDEIEDKLIDFKCKDWQEVKVCVEKMLDLGKPFE